MGLLYAAISSRLPLPHQLVLICPGLNVEMNNPAMYDIAHTTRRSHQNIAFLSIAFGQAETLPFPFLQRMQRIR